MNKTIKIISILIITIALICTLNQTCLAANSVISSLDSASFTSNDIGDVKTVSVEIFKAIRNIAVIVAMLVITYLGIKYMVGSTEERASYKKAFIPLIVGVILVAAATQIVTMMFSVAK